ncbi:MAG: hypothetical protein WB815_07680, partial [Nitrososphaeraceae archaeon]
TNTDQKLGQENTGSGDTINENRITNDIEVEEESATLSVCKVVGNVLLSPEEFDFTVKGNNPSPAHFAGDPNCVDVTIGPGEYTVSEVSPPLGGRTLTITIEGNCEQVGIRAIGVIQSGETQECRFTNSFGD